MIKINNPKVTDVFTYDVSNLIPIMKIKSIISLIGNKGNLAYEYHPFRNFRYLKDKPGIAKYSLQDFDTEKFNFDLRHPVDIKCLASYDGSVNLILNDGKNSPKLINSRFSVREHNTYEVVDRIGTNDTNLYDYELFDLDTSLYKKVNSIPKINFIGISHGGKLPVGNYNFYFKYCDADGNETDFIGESGSIVCHIGTINDPRSIRGGLLNEDSNKLVQFIIYNVDSAYDYINVYYTRLTSMGNQEKIIEAKKIKRKFKVKGTSCFITIDGFEELLDIPISEINQQYFIASNAETQAICLNRLFLANLGKPTLDIETLTDLSLRMLPYYNSLEAKTLIGNLDQNYHDSEDKYEYYNVMNIYNYLGYWDEEIYRLGVVYIMNDDSLSPVFNIRGRDKIPSALLMLSNAEDCYEINKNLDIKITYDEISYLIGDKGNRENARGVIRISDNNASSMNVYSIGVRIDKEVLDRLKTIGIKGMFFVRLKRIPTILAQAFVIGHDTNSGIPLIKYDDKYYAESFIDKFGKLDSTYKDRLYEADVKASNNECAICPEFELRLNHFNNLFTDTEFVVRSPHIQTNKFNRDKYLDRHYYSLDYSATSGDLFKYPYILSIGDNVPARRNELSLFCASIGDSENINIFKCVSKDKKIRKSDDIQKDNCIVRGAFGPYLGLSGYRGEANKILNIYIPNYSLGKLNQYFKIRYDDSSAYYAISDRFSLDDLYKNRINLFRGDCYICNFTHRLNRNFQDPEVPNADKVVDTNTWKKWFNLDKPEDLNNINRGDLNAVNLGSWVTIKVRSNINLSMRDWDNSYPDEVALTGVTRSFYPLEEMSLDGNHKIPESNFINSGLSSSTSLKVNYRLPDVPYLKNVFLNRIIYSDLAVSDSFKNGFRVFPAGNFRDYQATYGGIVKLIELDGDLICVLEHGIIRIAVNERVLVGEGTGGSVYVNSNNVLPVNTLVISDTFGSLWKESVIKTPHGVYGVDTIAKKIWKTDGRSVVNISDDKVQKFLNENITLSERENSPIIGIRNVKTHYNAFKQDVMFTFYDNVYGFEDKAWNLCYNETLNNGLFTTFYSWMPSYSENIDNILFTFNRETSKWIAKLATSQSDVAMSDGIVLSNVKFTGNSLIGKLSLCNRSLPNTENTGVLAKVTFSIERDRNNYFKYFELKDTATIGEVTYINNTLLIKEGYNINDVLSKNRVINLNIKAEVTAFSSDTNINQIKNYVEDFNSYFLDNYGYYLSQIFITSEQIYNNPGLTKALKLLPNLNTDFWKHGLSGIIDIKDDILPCFWYGELHPFEFEFVVNVNSDIHKIFDDLQIISNNAEPDSFHYEIIGDCFDFANDKKNMYIRLERTKCLYLANGYDTTFDRNTINEKIKELQNIKSAIFPLYCIRLVKTNSMQDFYSLINSPLSKNYLNLAGAELIHTNNPNEYHIINHAKAVDIKKHGRLRGNMDYLEDKWRVQINPINVKFKNESKWDIVPISLGNSPIPNEVLQNNKLLYIPDELFNIGYNPQTGIDATDWTKSDRRLEILLKDKYIKIKITYKGDKLAIIAKVRTLFRIVV